MFQHHNILILLWLVVTSIFMMMQCFQQNMVSLETAIMCMYRKYPCSTHRREWISWGVEGSVRPKSFIDISRGVEVWIFSGTTQLFSWIINFFMCVPAKLAVVIWKFVSEYSMLLHFPISMFTSHAALFMFSFFGLYLCSLYVFSFVYTMYLHVLLTLFSVSHKPNCLAQVQFSRYWNIIYCTDISLDIVFLIG